MFLDDSQDQYSSGSGTERESFGDSVHEKNGNYTTSQMLNDEIIFED